MADWLITWRIQPAPTCAAGSAGQLRLAPLMTQLWRYQRPQRLAAGCMVCRFLLRQTCDNAAGDTRTTPQSLRAPLISRVGVKRLMTFASLVRRTATLFAQRDTNQKMSTPGILAARKPEYGLQRTRPMPYSIKHLGTAISEGTLNNGYRAILRLKI